MKGFGRLRVEGELIRELRPSLNKQVEGRTMKESMEDNKIKVVDNQKLYYEKTKNKLMSERNNTCKNTANSSRNVRSRIMNRIKRRSNRKQLIIIINTEQLSNISIIFSMTQTKQNQYNNNPQ